MARPRSNRYRSSRPTRSGRSGFSGVWLFLLGLLVGAGGLYFAFRGTPESSAREAVHTGAREAAAATPRPAEAVRPPDVRRDVPPAPQESPTPVEETGEDEGAPAAEGEKLGRVALVIDDLGRSLEDLPPLQRLGVPVSYAVLPFEEQTPAVVAELRRQKVEILLHLPMEPRNGEDPGPGALTLGMSDEELRQHTLAALRAVPGAVGVNNHMGSGLSAHEPSMEAILGVLGARRLFFLDSRTSAESVGYRLAHSLGLPAAERQVFLDDDQRPEAIQAQFQRLLQLARTRGAAIAIGHPHPATLAVLAAEVPRARQLGYEFVPVSFLLDRPDEEAE